ALPQARRRRGVLSRDRAAVDPAAAPAAVRCAPPAYWRRPHDAPARAGIGLHACPGIEERAHVSLRRLSVVAGRPDSSAGHAARVRIAALRFSDWRERG